MDIERSLHIAKALADRSRMMIMRAVMDGPLCTEELSGLLGLAPSTVSFHVKKLAEAGLVTTSRDQYYTVCAPVPRLLDLPLGALLGDTAAGCPPRDERSIRERRKVVESFFRDGTLAKMPAQRWKRLVVLEELATLFPCPGPYSEMEVNERLRRVYPDHCLSRRLLVDEGFLTRSGGMYTPAGKPEKPPSRALDRRPGMTAAHDQSGAGAGMTPRVSTREGATMKMEHKARREEYKRADRIAGIFQIRNRTTGKVLLGSTLNLHGPLNRIEFELQLGCHKNRALQDDYNRYGRDAFVFEVLEEVKQTDDPAFDAEAELVKLEEKYRAGLNADNTYNDGGDIRFLRRRRQAPAR